MDTHSTKRFDPPPFDAAMELALQLAILREGHALDEIVVADLDGTPLSSAGDPDSARALAALASATLKDAPMGASRTLHCGKVHLELLLLSGCACVLAARANFLVIDPSAMAVTLSAAFATQAIEQSEPPTVDGLVDGTDGEFDFDLGWEAPDSIDRVVAA